MTQSRCRTFRAITPENPAHLRRVRALGCLVCGERAIAHHIRCDRDGIHYSADQKAPDEDAIPLCPRHHKDGGFGISYHDGPREWQQNFGTELALLAITEVLLLERGEP